MSTGSNSQKKGGNAELSAVVAGASEEVKRALGEILELERDHLPQKSPNASKLGREIADIIRRLVP